MANKMERANREGVLLLLSMSSVFNKRRTVHVRSYQNRLSMSPRLVSLLAHDAKWSNADTIGRSHDL